MQPNAHAATPPYPIRVEGHLETPSRWSWLLKWLLALPHVVVLAGLWLAFFASSVAAFVAVAFTGRYPRTLFDFNVGVMRWSWRVVFYAYGANGTDRYPPFTLADVPDYPARLEVAYPQHEQRGLALVGWWLAGIPQYLIAGMFVGGGVLGFWGGASWMGLIGLLVLIAAAVLLVRGTYPRSIFDLVLGLNRWVLRVVAYAALMTTEYPPFRIDTGEDDLPGAIAMPTAEAATTAKLTPMPQAPGARTHRRNGAGNHHGAGRSRGHRRRCDRAGVRPDPARRERLPDDQLVVLLDRHLRPGIRQLPRNRIQRMVLARRLLGTIRIQSLSSRSDFVGIAPANAAAHYLAGVAHAEAGDLGAQSGDFHAHAGQRAELDSGAQHFWVARASGAGEQTLTWKVRSGNWRVIVDERKRHARRLQRAEHRRQVPAPGHHRRSPCSLAGC